MAVARTDETPHPGEYDNALKYAMERLDPEEPVSPSDLAEDYGCTPNYMRKSLSELVDEGFARRISRGSYVLSTEMAGTDTEARTTSDDHSTRSGADFRSTADLYQEQHTTVTDDEDTGDTTRSTAAVPVEPGSDDPDGDDGDAAGGGLPLPADPKTLGLILGVALVLWVTYRSLGGSGGDGADVEDGTDDEQDQLGGGLAQ